MEGKITLLLVEDEAPIRRLAQRMLENDIGFHGEPVFEVGEQRDVVKEIHELFAPSRDGAQSRDASCAVVEIELPQGR